MKKISISINQFAEFLVASDAKKSSIIKQQKKPFLPMTIPYQIARLIIIKFFKHDYSEQEVIEGIEMIKSKIPISDFQRRSYKNSVAALQSFLRSHLPTYIKKFQCTFVTSKNKCFTMEGMDIIVSPDLIIRWKNGSSNCIGGVKFHFSKDKGFSPLSAQCAAFGVYLFLKNEVAKEDEIVDTSYCLSVDVFQDRITPAPGINEGLLNKMKEACSTIIELWHKDAA